MRDARSVLAFAVPSILAAFACSSKGGLSTAGDAAIACPAQFGASDAGQPATITVDTSAVVNTFVPKLLFGVNSGYFITQRDSTKTQPKVQAAGNYFIRYPGGSSSDDYHWNGTGSYDANHYWVPSPTTFTAGFPGTETYRGTTSSYGTWSLATDGDPATRWLSNVETAFPTAQWLYVDLGAAKSLDSIQIAWGTPYATSFQIQTWSSSASYPPPYQASGGTWVTTSAGIVTGTGGTQTVAFNPVSAEFVRVLLTASSAGDGGAYSIAELTAYSGATQVTNNVATSSQSAATASSTDPASQGVPQSNFDFESFMTYMHSFTPAADPVITVNVGTGTPQEAAAWVHYANIVKGYGIRYWQIGNEMEGNWETGGPMNAQDYVNRYVKYYEAMKAEDPSILVLGPVSGGIDDPSNLGDGQSLIADFIALLHTAGLDNHIDGIDFHWYPNWETVSDSTALAKVSQLGVFSANLKSWLSATTAKADVPVFLTEYNIGLGSLNSPVSLNQLVNGLWVASSLGEFIHYFGNGGGTNLWNIVSSWTTTDATDPSAGDLGYLQGTNNSYRYQEHADYWAMQMMSSDWAIAGDTQTHQLVASTTSQPSLATYADLRPDGALTLAVVNRDEVNAYSASIGVAPFVVGPAADVWTFDASNYVWNTSAKPYHADPDSAPTHVLTCGAAASTPFTFSPASITVIRFAPPGAPTAFIPDAGSPSAAADGGAGSAYVLIDDMEDTPSPSGPIALSLGNTGLSPGYWWDAVSTGSPSNTMSPSPFAYTALPSPHETLPGITSNEGAHLTCLMADLYGWCEAGFNLANPELPYDISAYTGIVFWGMSAVSNTVKVQISNNDTVPSGGKCGQSDASVDQCWDNFAKYVSLTPTWQRFEVKFSDLQQEGWGHPVPSGIFDPTTARGIDFEVLGPTSATAAPVSADFWIDDVYFE